MSKVGELLARHDISDYPWLENPIKRMAEGESPIHHGALGFALMILGGVMSFALPVLAGFFENNGRPEPLPMLFSQQPMPFGNPFAQAPPPQPVRMPAIRNFTQAPVPQQAPQQAPQNPHMRRVGFAYRRDR
jgi:hypothetical protein